MFKDDIYITFLLSNLLHASPPSPLVLCATSMYSFMILLLLFLLRCLFFIPVLFPHPPPFLPSVIPYPAPAEKHCLIKKEVSHKRHPRLGFISSPLMQLQLASSWSGDGILGHQFNKRHKSFAPCYLQSFLLGDFKENHILLWFLKYYKKSA
jgi:hypothetical protein